MTETKIIEQILEISKRLHQRNFLAATDGNISYRISDNKILMTPAGRPKAFIEAKDMAIVNLNGNVLKNKPSSELLMHLTIYQTCPEAKCVIHAHPPTAIAWTIAYPKLKEIPCDAFAEVILATGRIPVVPYARPGTQAMGDNLVPFLPDHRLLVLARHGGISWGEDIEEAYNGIERLEHSAHILQSAHAFGGLTSLPESETEALRAIHQNRKPRTL